MMRAAELYSLLVAQSGNHDLTDPCPLSRIKQTSCGCTAMPERTWSRGGVWRHSV